MFSLVLFVFKVLFVCVVVLVIVFFVLDIVVFVPMLSRGILFRATTTEAMKREEGRLNREEGSVDRDPEIELQR